MVARSGLLKRITNEPFGPHMLFRAIVLFFGFLLTSTLDHSGVLRSPIGRRLYFCIYAFGKNFFEGDKIALLRERLKPGDVFLDVGGAYGYFSFIASQIVGPASKVIVIEPPR